MFSFEKGVRPYCSLSFPIWVGKPAHIKLNLARSYFKGPTKNILTVLFQLFLQVSKSLFFNLSSNCSNVLNLRNLQEQV